MTRDSWPRNWWWCRWSLKATDLYLAWRKDHQLFYASIQKHAWHHAIFEKTIWWSSDWYDACMPALMFQNYIPSLLGYVLHGCWWAHEWDFLSNGAQSNRCGLSLYFLRERDVWQDTMRCDAIRYSVSERARSLIVPSTYCSKKWATSTPIRAFWKCHKVVWPGDWEKRLRR
jgi:hypothetical protein